MWKSLEPFSPASLQADSRPVLVKLRRPCLHLQRLGSRANLNLTIRSSRARFAASAEQRNIVTLPWPRSGPA